MMLTNSKNIASDTRLTVLFAEENKLVCEAWRLIFREENRFKVIADCGSPESAILQAKKTQPEVIILEIKPPGLSGIEKLRLMRKFSPDSKILGVSRYSFSNIARELFKAGITGFITKASLAEEMLLATNQISDGKNYVCQAVSKTPRCFHDADDSAAKLKKLCISEMEVLIGLKNGMTYQEIAKELNMTTTMVEIYRYHILKKLQLWETTQLSGFVNEHQMAY